MVLFSECFSEKNVSDNIPQKYQLHDVFHHPGKAMFAILLNYLFVNLL